MNAAHPAITLLFLTGLTLFWLMPLTAWLMLRGQQDVTAVFKEMRAGLLPTWLRCECDPNRVTIKEAAAQFAEAGYPYRGEHFL